MKLFEPITINEMTLKNRIVMPPMQLKIGIGNSRAQAYYRARAEGGVGAIVMCATSVDLLTDNKVWRRSDGICRFVTKMKIFCRQIRRTGARIGIQLWHGNQFPAGDGSAHPDSELVAPSPQGDRRAMTIEEIEAVIHKFGQAAATAKNAGFDFVEVHGAHGYLACQFFSGADNRRSDQYGGDLSGRMRFGIEVVTAMRRAVGPSYPIFYRLGAEEKRPDGIMLHQSQAFAVELEKCGVDAFDVSIGNPVGNSVSPGKHAQPGTHVPLAEAIKKVVSVPVMAVGRLNTLKSAQAVIEEGRADIAGVGRQLIADPQWPDKIRAGRHDDIVACISCNTCFTPLRSSKWRPGMRICKVNPQAGREVDSRQPD